MENFLNQVLAYEQQGINRQALMLLIKPELEVIDKDRKAIKSSISEQVKSLGAVEAVKACNAISPSIPGSDGAARSRLQRRRTWLKSILSSTHTDYDFTLQDGTLFAEYIGSAIVREAKKIMSTLTMLQDMDFDIPIIEQRDIEIALSDRAGTDTPKTEALLVSTGTVDMVAKVANRARSLVATLGISTETEAETEAETKVQQE